MTRLEELEKQAKELLDEIAKIKNNEKKGNLWKPEDGDIIFYIDSDEYKIQDAPFTTRYVGREETATELDYKMGNCFATEAEAEKMLEKIKIYMQLKRLADEINEEPIDWCNGNQRKYHIYFEKSNDGIHQDFIICGEHVGDIYSTNYKFLEIALERIGSEDLYKLFE